MILSVTAILVRMIIGVLVMLFTGPNRAHSARYACPDRSRPQLFFLLCAHRKSPKRLLGTVHPLAKSAHAMRYYSCNRVESTGQRNGRSRTKLDLILTTR